MENPVQSSIELDGLVLLSWSFMMRISKKFFPGLLCVGLLMSCAQVRSENQFFEIICHVGVMIGVKSYVWCGEHKYRIVAFLSGFTAYGLYRMLRKDKEKTPTTLTEEIKRGGSEIEKVHNKEQNLKEEEKPDKERKRT